MGQRIQWTKQNLWKTAFKKFERIWSAWADNILSNFLKAVFHKFYLVHSGILCPKWSMIANPYKYKQLLFSSPVNLSTAFSMKIDTYLWLSPKFADVQKVSFSNPYLKFQNTLKVKTCITEPNRVPATMFLPDNKVVKNKKLFEAYFLTWLFFNVQFTKK